MKKYLLAALLAGLTHLAFAQAQDVTNQPATNKKVGFALLPQALFFNGLRVDIQPYLKPRHQLVVAPQVYYANNPSLLYSEVADMDELRGLGLELNYRIFPKEGKPLYGAAGVGYNFFQVGYPTTSYVPTNEGEMPTYENGKVSNRQRINRLGASVMMGWQMTTLYDFFIDLYWGVGFRYAFVSKDYDDTVNFNGGMWSMAHRGTCLILGVKIGFEL
jgi:hypothetical protein